MNWFLWALLSAFFRGIDCCKPAKVGVQTINSNMATAIRTVVILIFAWAIALATKNESFSAIGRRNLDFSDSVGNRHQPFLAVAIFAPCNFLDEASQVAPVDKLSVVIAIVLAAIFLHEKMTWHSLAGRHAHLCGSCHIGICVGVRRGAGFSLRGFGPCQA